MNDEYELIDGEFSDRVYPVMLLVADLENGEGDITSCDEFNDWGDVMQLDLLQDWISLLQSIYNLTLQGFEMDDLLESKHKGPFTKSVN